MVNNYLVLLTMLSNCSNSKGELMKRNITKQLPRLVLVGLVATIMGAVTVHPLGVFASSHREAPLITADPKADATDLYAFVSPDKAGTVTLIANYVPFGNPPSGPNFDSFGDDVQYDINVDNNGDALPDIIYRYDFTTTRQNPNTFLYNVGPISSLADPNWNVRQTYTLTKIQDGQSTVLGENLPTPPSNVGAKSTPNYNKLQASAVKEVATGIKTFAGQSDDPFYADLGGLFDLLTIRKVPGNAGGGVNGLQGFNVQSLALQVPIAELTSDKSTPTVATSPAAVIGVWTTASRQSTTVLGGGAATGSGEYVQVSRLGAPLVNEVVVPLGAKDLFNSSKPADDAQFANGVANPELGTLLKALYKVKVPPQDNFGTPNQRDDLEAIFLTGIPDLTKPANGTPSEQLRLNVAVPSTKSPNRLGVLAKDTQGYPNGRRLADDVVDISLQAVAGVAYPLFHKDFKPDPLATKLGDGVDKNDKSFRTSFPYLALPNDGLSTALSPVSNKTNADAANKSDGNKGISTAAATALGLGALLLGYLLASMLKKRPDNTGDTRR